MKVKTFIKSILTGLYYSLKRFPISIALSTCMVAILIITSEIINTSGYNDPNIETLNKVSMALFLGFWLSLCAKLLFEKYTYISNNTQILTYILSGIILVGYYFLLLKDLNMISISRYIALNFALILCFLYIPSLHKREHIELYSIKIFLRFFITFIYSIVLYLGLVAILFTLNKLLNIAIHSNLYYYTWLITCGIFAPIFFLADIPQQNEDLKTYSFPKFFKILLLYIVMPLITVYLTILYIYFGKIIITSTWPVGLVSHLVLWYAAVCVGVLFFITPLKDNIWVNKFTFFLPKLILPILIMMFISMGIRIKAYGITENRYYVVILGLWILFIMLYITIKKSSNNIILPISLSIVAIACVFGPLSSFPVSKWSQNIRFDYILSKNQMIADNKIIPKGDIPESDQSEISRILSYFKKSHKLSDIKYLNDTFSLSDMPNTFGFAYTEYDPYAHNDQYFSYYTHKNSLPIEITGYDYMFDFRIMQSSINHNNIKVDYNYGTGKVKIALDNNAVYSLDLVTLVEKLHSKYPDEHSLTQEDLIFDDENQIIKVKLIFSNISASRTNLDNTIKYNGGDFILLLKLK